MVVERLNLLDQAKSTVQLAQFAEGDRVHFTTPDGADKHALVLRLNNPRTVVASLTTSTTVSLSSILKESRLSTKIVDPPSLASSTSNSRIAPSKPICARSAVHPPETHRIGLRTITRLSACMPATTVPTDTRRWASGATITQPS